MDKQERRQQLWFDIVEPMLLKVSTYDGEELMERLTTDDIQAMISVTRAVLANGHLRIGGFPR